MKISSVMFQTLIILAALLVLLPSSRTATTLLVEAQTDKRILKQQQTSPVSSWPIKSKRWALVIGVDQYRDSQVSRLKGADNDAKALANALIHYAGFLPDQVILLATDQPEERQPTRVNILRRLSNLAAVMPKDGLLLVSFAGHGIERNGQAYLIPTDAQVSDDISFLEETAISVTRVKDRIRETGVQQVVVLLDACRNDPTGRGITAKPLTEAYVRGFNFDVRNREVTAFATIYATAVGQLAYEYSEKRQGYFTWAVVEAMKGAAANEKGEVTLAALLKYIQEAVPKQVAIDWGTGRQQRPFAIIEGYKANELVIAAAKPASHSEITPNLQENREQSQQSSNQSRVGTNSKKSGKILILLTEVIGEKLAGDGAIARLLLQKMVENNLSVTLGSELANEDLARVKQALQQVQAGSKKAGDAIPFAIAISGKIVTTLLDPYQGLYVAVADGSLNAIDTSDGKTVALEDVSGVRGFGNTRDQAARNALKNAGENLAESLVKQILANLR